MDRTFAEAEAISWLAVPGQITLSGVALETADIQVIDDGLVAPSSLDPVDLDGDGDLDLIGAAFDGSRIRWWRNDGGRTDRMDAGGRRRRSVGVAPR